MKARILCDRLAAGERAIRILLTGASGQLGSELRQVFGEGDLVSLTHADLELTNPAQVREILAKYQPRLILNTAAYHRVDECEDFPEHAFAVNAIAVRELAIAAKEVGAVLVHFSTDYIFDGRQRRPYGYRQPCSPAGRLPP